MILCALHLCKTLICCYRNQILIVVQICYFILTIAWSTVIFTFLNAGISHFWAIIAKTHVLFCFKTLFQSSWLWGNVYRYNGSHRNLCRLIKSHTMSLDLVSTVRVLSLPCASLNYAPLPFMLAFIHFIPVSEYKILNSIKNQLFSSNSGMPACSQDILYSFTFLL